MFLKYDIKNIIFTRSWIFLSSTPNSWNYLFLCRFLFAVSVFHLAGLVKKQVDRIMPENGSQIGNILYLLPASFTSALSFHGIKSCMCAFWKIMPFSKREKRIKNLLEFIGRHVLLKGPRTWLDTTAVWKQNHKHTSLPQNKNQLEKHPPLIPQPPFFFFLANLDIFIWHQLPVCSIFRSRQAKL